MTSPSTIIQVGIVEDDRLILQTLKQLLNLQPDLHVVQTHDSVEGLLEQDFNLDVLLLDIDLPGMSGIEAIPHFLEKQPKLNILMLTVHEETQLVFEALKTGAVGYLLKSSKSERIAQNVREVFEGGAPMSPTIARKVIGSFRPVQETILTERETEVLQRLAKGANNKQIAEDLFVSRNTVKAHVKNIYHKLQVHSRAEAVSKALKKRII
ncbi:MAG: response regulator transcription factor [Bacteroidota bacterium]